MLSPGLIEALGQIMAGLQSIGDGVTFVIGFVLNYLGIAASQQMIQMMTIMILLAVVWKIGSKLTSSIFWFFIVAQAMSFLGAV
jgi:small basic protein